MPREGTDSDAMVFGRSEVGARWPPAGRGLGGQASCRRSPRRLAQGQEKAVTFEQLRHFLSRVQRDPDLKRQVEEAITADEVALLAQGLGYAVSGSDILRFSGQSADGVRVTRIDHPGEYPGRYY